MNREAQRRPFGIQVPHDTMGAPGTRVIEAETTTSASAFWLDYGARALSLAGQILGPENRSPASTRLGRLLLRESCVAAARAIAGEDSASTVAEAVAALAARRELPPVLRRPSGPATLVAALEDGDDRTLPEAERLVAELMDFARRGGPPKPKKWRRRAIVAALFLGIAGTVAGPSLYNRQGWRAYRWTTSSSSFGLPKSGTLADRGTDDLLCHTENEAKPWLLIDMLAIRTIEHIAIENRQDCCAARGLPLVVEAGETVDHLTEIGRQTALFDTWNLEFPRQKARYVRIHAEATTILHLHEVRIP